MKMTPNRIVISVAAIAASLVAGQATHAAVWAGGNGNWSVNTNPGWNATGVPNAIGDTATKSDTTSAVVTQDIAAGVTVGTISLTGSTNSNATSFTLTPTNAITLNQDGASSGSAAITNSTTGTGNTTRLIVGTGTLTLADNLVITNSSTTTSASAISLGATIGGTGNVTINNGSSTAAVSLTGANGFGGSVLIQSGLVSYSTTTALGITGNLVTLGTTSGASAILTNTGTNTTSNNITVAAANSASTLGSSSTAGATNTIFSGNITLNGSLNVTSTKTGTADVRLTGIISGAGGLNIGGTGKVELGNGSTSITNTYTGNTSIIGSGPVTVSDNDQLTFVIGATGVNNKVTGTTGQALTLDGDFIFNLAGAAANGTWTIVDYAHLAPTFSSTFTVAGTGWAQASDVWTKNSGSTTYTFTEANGILTAVTPEPASCAVLGLSLMAMAARRRRV